MLNVVTLYFATWFHLLLDSVGQVTNSVSDLEFRIRLYVQVIRLNGLTLLIYSLFLLLQWLSGFDDADDHHQFVVFSCNLFHHQTVI